MTQEAMNVASQCRATASADLCKNILVDGGSGFLFELLLDAAKAIETLAQEKALQALHNENERLGLYRDAYAEQEPVMVLPDGSAFGVMSFSLPDDHWLYAPNEYRDGEHEPIDLPKPVLTRPFRDAVVAAVRYAVRGATMRGQETDFDPDALVQNAVYALCGPYTTPPAQPPQRTEQEPVAKYSDIVSDGGLDPRNKFDVLPQRTWVGLTEEEFWELDKEDLSLRQFVQAIEAKLKEKNQ